MSSNRLLKKGFQMRPLYTAREGELKQQHRRRRNALGECIVRTLPVKLHIRFRRIRSPHGEESAHQVAMITCRRSG